MAKKPRSQRRKKGDASTAVTGTPADDVDVLSEDHTIAESIATDFSEAFDDEDEFLKEIGEPQQHNGIEVNASGGGSSSAAVATESRMARLQDALAGLQELPAEKRSAKRESVLRVAFKALTQFAAGPAAAALLEQGQHLDAIRQAAFHGLRAGQPAEQYAACRVLEACSVVLGGDQDDWVESIAPTLNRCVGMFTRAAAVRVAALRAYSMAIFICSSDTEANEGLMDICEAVAEPEYRQHPVPVSLRATALDCWALLATTVEDLYLAGQDDVQMGRGLALLALLKNCLDTTSVDLRSAAGECMALIHEARLNLGFDDATAEAGEHNNTERRYRRGSWDGTQWEVLMDEVKQRIAELSVESGHHMSKKAKKEQRATFREFMATIVDDEMPEEIVHFRNAGSVELHSWREIIQLNFVRHCLQGGFQIQLLTNVTLQAIFGVDYRALSGQYGGTGGMSQLEKRLILSKTSEAAKNADRKMERRRKKREHIKNDFLTADQESIW